MIPLLITEGELGWEGGPSKSGSGRGVAGSKSGGPRSTHTSVVDAGSVDGVGGPLVADGESDETSKATDSEVENGCCDDTGLGLGLQMKAHSSSVSTRDLVT